MKKVVLIVAALVLVVSGVAAVSAYEAHIINVKAHVENALTVDTANVDFGTVFPQEFIKYHRSISLSDSAIAEKGDASGDLDSVTLQVFAEWKAVPAGVVVAPVVLDDAGIEYFAWMGNFLWVGFNPSQFPMAVSGMTLVGPPDDPPLSAQPVLAFVTLDGVTNTMLAIAVDVPVFEGYYNVLTDPTPKPSGLDVPSWIIPADFPGFDPDGMDFGIDLKVQVINIVRVP